MPDLAGTVVLLGFLQGAVMVGVLAARRTDRLANRFLAALVGAVAAMLLLGYVNARWGFGGYPHLIALGHPLPFLFGPLLYLYIAALTRPIARFDPRFLVHGLPFAADVLYMSQAFYLKSGDEKLALADAYLAGEGPLAFRLMGTLEVVTALAYVAASFFALRRYSRKIEGFYSDLARIDLRWLLAMVLAHAAVWSIVAITNLLGPFGVGGQVLQGLEQTVQLGSALTVFLTGYISLWQPELYAKALAAAPAAPEPAAPEPAAPAEESATVGDTPEPDRPKYQRNRLDDREAEEFAEKLKALMEREQAYKDAELTLPVLAETLGTTPHLLSQVLNVRIGRSFYVFVNSYRTEALMAALSDPRRQERGVLELALESGFNSKSTLNAFFKKQTGLTPTEFRRRAQAQIAQA